MDARDRHAVYRHQGRNAAAHITESAEGLQASHTGAQHVAGRKKVQIFCLAHLLCLRAGKRSHGRLLCLVQRLHGKTYCATHAGNQRYIAHTALPHAPGALFVGHDAQRRAQVQPQGLVFIEHQRAPAQKLPRPHCILQCGQAVAIGAAHGPFGGEFHVVHHPFRQAACRPPPALFLAAALAAQ